LKTSWQSQRWYQWFEAVPRYQFAWIVWSEFKRGQFNGHAALPLAVPHAGDDRLLQTVRSFIKHAQPSDDDFVRDIEVVSEGCAGDVLVAGWLGTE
jgi:hypothetical protein